MGNIIKPQAGYQTKVLSSEADIVIGGGAAGVGKTFSLLIEPVRHIHVPKFGALILRRTTPMIKNTGGLWDESLDLYNGIGGEPVRSILEWRFQSGASLKFAHLEREDDKLNYQGSQIPFIGWDELTHFTQTQFEYVTLSRGRSSCGVNPYSRCTTNPDPDSWVASLIDWWIGEDGFPIAERDGVLQYFSKQGDEYIWGHSKEQLLGDYWSVFEPQVKATNEKRRQQGYGDMNPMDLIKSLTFIGGSIYDNIELLDKNPQYLGGLMALDEAEKSKLLDGNWKKRVDNSDLYEYHSFEAIFTNSHVEQGELEITADVALEGSDKFVIGVWRGMRLIDVDIVPKSSGKEVENLIRGKMEEYGVRVEKVIFDADGVGGFLGGYFRGSTAFKGNQKPFEVKGDKQNYQNLKAQCFYEMGRQVKLGNVYVTPYAANKTFEGKKFKDLMMYERRAVKKITTNTGKLTLNKKDDQKTYLKGKSPDVLDMFGMKTRSMFSESKGRIISSSSAKISSRRRG